MMQISDYIYFIHKRSYENEAVDTQKECARTARINNGTFVCDYVAFLSTRDQEDCGAKAI